MIDDLIKLYSGQNIHVKFYVSARSRLLNLDYYLQFLSNSGVIVDVGCGYGVLANYLSLNLPGNQIIGIDMNNDRITAAKSTVGKRTNIQFYTQDAINWAWPTCSGIMMTDFLHHISPPNQKIVLDRAAKSLGKGGILLISEVDPAAKPVYRYWASYLSDRILYPSSKSHFQTSKYWYDILNSLSFQVKTVRPPGIAFAGIIYICSKI